MGGPNQNNSDKKIVVRGEYGGSIIGIILVSIKVSIMMSIKVSITVSIMVSINMSIMVSI